MSSASEGRRRRKRARRARKLKERNSSAIVPAVHPRPAQFWTMRWNSAGGRHCSYYEVYHVLEELWGALAQLDITEQTGEHAEENEKFRDLILNKLAVVSREVHWPNRISGFQWRSAACRARPDGGTRLLHVDSGIRATVFGSRHDYACAACGRFTSYLGCAACRTVRYCSTSCRVSHRIVHGYECRELLLKCGVSVFTYETAPEIAFYVIPDTEQLRPPVLAVIAVKAVCDIVLSYCAAPVPVLLRDAGQWLPDDGMPRGRGRGTHARALMEPHTLQKSTVACVHEGGTKGQIEYAVITTEYRAESRLSHVKDLFRVRPESKHRMATLQHAAHSPHLIPFSDRNASTPRGLASGTVYDFLSGYAGRMQRQSEHKSSALIPRTCIASPLRSLTTTLPPLPHRGAMVLNGTPLTAVPAITIMDYSHLYNNRPDFSSGWVPHRLAPGGLVYGRDVRTSLTGFTGAMHYFLNYARTINSISAWGYTGAVIHLSDGTLGTAFRPGDGCITCGRYVRVYGSGHWGCRECFAVRYCSFNCADADKEEHKAECADIMRGWKKYNLHAPNHVSFPAIDMFRHEALPESLRRELCAAVTAYLPDVLSGIVVSYIPGRRHAIPEADREYWAKDCPLSRLYSQEIKEQICTGGAQLIREINRERLKVPIEPFTAEEVADGFERLCEALCLLVREYPLLLHPAEIENHAGQRWWVDPFA